MLKIRAKTIKNQLIGISNFGHCDLPFNSFDLEALDRLAQGSESFDFAQDRESVERLVEPFGNCVLLFEIIFLCFLCLFAAI